MLNKYVNDYKEKVSDNSTKNYGYPELLFFGMIKYLDNHLSNSIV